MNMKTKTQHGFTLIELMIVVAVIAILAAIAYPSYSEYIIKTRRASGSACMMEMAQFMERYYTTNMTYVGAALPTTACRQETAQHYTYSLDGAATATAYRVQAQPQGAQSSSDTKCATLKINQAGTKSVTGSYSGNVSGCF